MSTTSSLTIEDVIAASERSDGFGYTGERALAIAKAGALGATICDEVIAHEASKAGWSHWDLLDWVNSKNGRHFGEAFFNGDPASAARYFNLDGVR